MSVGAGGYATYWQLALSRIAKRRPLRRCGTDGAKQMGEAQTTLYGTPLIDLYLCCHG